MGNKFILTFILSLNFFVTQFKWLALFNNGIQIQQQNDWLENLSIQLFVLENKANEQNWVLKVAIIVQT